MFQDVAALRNIVTWILCGQPPDNLDVLLKVQLIGIFKLVYDNPELIDHIESDNDHS
jgi:hypothetical protein